MKCLQFTFLMLLISLNGHLVSGQNNYLALEHSKSGRSTRIMENSRIKLKITDGPSEVGRIVFVSDEFFKINHRQFSVDQIAAIKRNRIIPDIIGGGLIAFGSLIWPLDIFFTLFTGTLFLGYTPVALPSILIGTGLCFLGQKYKLENGWEFTIVYH